MQQKIIGYTTGVFDLFHIGHLNILMRARERCDYLIVGVSTDALVLDRKQKKPVIPFDERVQIVRALRCVDEVVAQQSMDKLAAYRAHSFHRMFVGSDWQGTRQWQDYEREFAPLGVQIVYLPHTDGISSTQLAERIGIERQGNRQ